MFLVAMLTVTIHYCVAFRFMGSYNWGYKSPDMAYKCSYPTYNPTYTAHEPSSRDVHFRPRAGRGICSRGKLGDVEMSRHLQGSCCFFGGCRSERLYMGGCQNYGAFLGPYYSTAPNI